MKSGVTAGQPPPHARAYEVAQGVPFEPVAILLAKKTGRPVRIAFPFDEEFLCCPVRQPVLAECRSGANRDGSLVVRDCRLLLDAGAYVSWGTVTSVVMSSLGSVQTKQTHFAPLLAFNSSLCVNVKKPPYRNSGYTP